MASTLVRDSLARRSAGFGGSGPVANTREYYNILGVVLQDTGADLDAIDHFHRAIAIAPDHADAYFNWGTSLYHLCRWDEALDKYGQTFERDPHHARAHTVKGMIDLLHGRFEEGWTEYEWRMKCEEHQSTTVAPPLPLDHLDGKRVGLSGYMQPLGTDLECASFLLIENPVGCWYCEMPDMTGMLQVEMPTGKSLAYTRKRIRIEGTLTLNPADPENFLFTVTKAKVEEEE